MYHTNCFKMEVMEIITTYYILEVGVQIFMGFQILGGCDTSEIYKPLVNITVLHENDGGITKTEVCQGKCFVEELFNRQILYYLRNKSYVCET